MHISTLRIRNFRNFANAKFNFEAGVNTLIGENGAGKTNAFHALRLLLDESLPRNATTLRDSDFSRSLDQWRGHWIVISIDFEKLDLSEGCQVLKHQAGHMDKSQRGTYTLYYRPKHEARTKLFTASSKDAKGAIALAEKLTVDDYEACWSGRAGADFNEKKTYEAVIGNPTKGQYPDPAKDDQALLGVRIQPIHREITCTFIKALRDVIAELQNYRGNPLLALLRGLESEIQITDAKKITDAVTSLNADIASLPEIKDLSVGIQRALHQSVGRTFAPDISIESTLPDSMEQLLKKLGILVGDGDGGTYRGEMTEQSLGSANLIYLALKFLEYERKLSSDRAAHFLLIEEPEAHLHAHVQRTLFQNLHGTQTQVIVSTHSTQISSIAKIRSVNVLANRVGESAVYQPANGLDAATVSRVERYVDAVRSTLLFAKGVILVEGEAELIMVPALVRGLFGVGVDELGVSVISMNSAFFEHIGVIFHQERIRRNCAIISDADTSLIDLPDDAANDDDEEKHFRAAQKAGAQRKASLEEFTGKSIWTEYFLAEHTFEVDFLAAGNAHEVAGTLASIYKKDSSHIEKATERLQSDDPIEAGKEILRLAEKLGKGWFALLLAEQITVRTNIPDYILKALAFSAQEVIRPETIKGMGLHRIFNENAWERVAEKFEETQDTLSAMPANDFIALYRERAPDDELSRFCKHLGECDPFLWS